MELNNRVCFEENQVLFDIANIVNGETVNSVESADALLFTCVTSGLCCTHKDTSLKCSRKWRIFSYKPFNNVSYAPTMAA